MAQHDMNIANQSFPSFRSDLNNALSAIQTTHSGTSLPTGAVAGQIWLDTTNATNPTLKFYDGADSISLATINYTANTVDWLDSSVSITGLSTSATGTVLTLSDTAHTTTVNLILNNQTEIRFNELTANGTNYIGLKAPASLSSDLTYTLPTAPASNNRALISSTAGVMSYTPYSFPASDGSANQLLKTDGAGALSFATVSSAGAFKNIIINGDMQIAQRSTSVASITTGAYRTTDRWLFDVSSLGTWTMSQSTDVPSGYGFAYSTKLDCTTADASPAAGDYLTLEQAIEGQNLQYLKKGTANAVSLTASFWVKSTKTGTFIAELFDSDNNRSISKSYTVSVSNTWEFKTVTFAGDTTGAFTNDNGKSLVLRFWLGAGTTYTSGTLNTNWGTATNANIAVGQVNIADNTVNDFLITGVQLEAGTSATDFEFLPIDVSLGRCLRYYYSWTNTGLSDGYYFYSPYVSSPANSTAALGVWFKTMMRASPTMSGTVSSGSLNRFTSNKDGAVAQYSSTSAATAYSISTFQADSEL